MNYLEEIKPLYQYVELYLEGKGCPNHETLQKLSDIDYRLRESEKVRIYGNERTEIYPTDIGCGSCVKGMMVNLKRWVNIKNNEGNVVEFKGVPPTNEEKEWFKELKERSPKSMTVEDLGLDVIGLSKVEETVEPEEWMKNLKWGEFKTYCKGLGINSKGKTRAELEEELKGL